MVSDFLESLMLEFRYDLWANLEAIDSIEQTGCPTRAGEIMAHVVGVQALWLDRLQESEARLEVWPILTPLEGRQWLVILADEWRATLARGRIELTRKASYVNSKGELWTNTVGDVVRHVLYHGAYHRGQVAMFLGRAGLAPAYTDYVHWRRAVQPDEEL